MQARQTALPLCSCWASSQSVSHLSLPCSSARVQSARDRLCKMSLTSLFTRSRSERSFLRTSLTILPSCALPAGGVRGRKRPRRPPRHLRRRRLCRARLGRRAGGGGPPGREELRDVVLGQGAGLGGRGGRGVRAPGHLQGAICAIKPRLWCSVAAACAVACRVAFSDHCPCAYEQRIATGWRRRPDVRARQGGCVRLCEEEEQGRARSGAGSRGGGGGGASRCGTAVCHTQHLAPSSRVRPRPPSECDSARSLDAESDGLYHAASAAHRPPLVRCRPLALRRRARRRRRLPNLQRPPRRRSRRSSLSPRRARRPLRSPLRRRRRAGRRCSDLRRRARRRRVRLRTPGGYLCACHSRPCLRLREQTRRLHCMSLTLTPHSLHPFFCSRRPLPSQTRRSRRQKNRLRSSRPASPRRRRPRRVALLFCLFHSHRSSKKRSWRTSLAMCIRCKLSRCMALRCC